MTWVLQGPIVPYDRLLSADEELTLSLPDQICNSPYCQPSNSYNACFTLVLDQLIIPKLIFFLILINYLVDIVLISLRRNSVLVTHES